MFCCDHEIYRIKTVFTWVPLKRVAEYKEYKIYKIRWLSFTKVKQIFDIESEKWATIDILD
jgi:hypothetical protein